MAVLGVGHPGQVAGDLLPQAQIAPGRGVDVVLHPLDPRRAGIEPFGWVINASLTPGATTHSVLRARADSELAHIARVERLSARGTWLVGWQPDPPIGTAALRLLARDAGRPAPAIGF